MTRPQKTFTIVLWCIAVTLMVGVLALKTFPQGRQTMAAPAGLDGGLGPQQAGHIILDPSATEELPVLYPAPDFSLTNQDNKTTTNADLAGHPWVADFIFTTCSTSCPQMSTWMKQLQSKLPKDVKLVSFSVDPVHDTPAILKDYAERYEAQPGRWLFLTGDEKTQERVIRSMKLVFAPATADHPLQHDEHLVLIDAKGQIRSYYQGDRLDDLVRDVNSLDSGAGR